MPACKTKKRAAISGGQRGELDLTAADSLRARLFVFPDSGGGYFDLKSMVAAGIIGADDDGRFAQFHRSSRLGFDLLNNRLPLNIRRSIITACFFTRSNIGDLHTNAQSNRMFTF